MSRMVNKAWRRVLLSTPGCKSGSIKTYFNAVELRAGHVFSLIVVFNRCVTLFNDQTDESLCLSRTLARPFKSGSDPAVLTSLSATPTEYWAVCSGNRSTNSSNDFKSPSLSISSISCSRTKKELVEVLRIRDLDYEPSNNWGTTWPIGPLAALVLSSRFKTLAASRRRDRSDPLSEFKTPSRPAMKFAWLLKSMLQ